MRLRSLAHLATSMLDNGEMQYTCRAGVACVINTAFNATTDTVHALLHPWRSVRYGPVTQAGEGVTGFGMYVIECLFRRGLGAVLVPWLRFSLWPARPPVCDWLSRM